MIRVDGVDVFWGGGNLARYHQTYGRDGRTIHLPLVDRVEAFQTYIYPLYVQFATKMIRVDGVDVFWGGGGQPGRRTTSHIFDGLTTHMVDRLEPYIYPW